MKIIDIRILDNAEVLVEWEDGHRSLFAADYLRLSCPCAACCDEWSGKRLVRPEQVARDISLQSFNPVGRYALKFVWSDGHQTGLYSFDFLRRLCKCSVCLPLVDKCKGEQSHHEN